MLGCLLGKKTTKCVGRRPMSMKSAVIHPGGFPYHPPDSLGAVRTFIIKQSRNTQGAESKTTLVATCATTLVDDHHRQWPSMRYELAIAFVVAVGATAAQQDDAWAKYLDAKPYS